MVVSPLRRSVAWWRRGKAGRCEVKEYPEVHKTGATRYLQVLLDARCCASPVVPADRLRTQESGDFEGLATDPLQHLDMPDCLLRNEEVVGSNPITSTMNSGP